MQLGKVIGTIVSTVKHDAYRGRKMLMVEFMKPDGTMTGKQAMAVDCVRAGVGDTVLVLKEGNSARLVLGKEAGPVLDLIVGVVDRVDLQKGGM